MARLTSLRWNALCGIHFIYVSLVILGTIIVFLYEKGIEELVS